MDPGTDSRRYRILDVVGRGGFGTVYRGEAMGAGGFSKEVALKVLHPGVEGNGEQLARLRDEARLLGLLKHRSIVGVDTLTRMHDRWTVVMEYVPGATVRDLLDRYGPLPLPMVLEIGEHVASALHAAYTLPGPDGSPLRLLHRDVKPSNLQVTRYGEVKLLDFGIARAEMERDRRGGVVYGSVPYLAPERLELRDTHQADVYALALTLVQAVTGTLPHAGAPPAERAQAARTSLEEIAAPPQLIALMERALATAPEDRPDARELEHELKRVQRLFTVFDPREWSQDHVGPALDELRPHAGELTGMVFTEGASADTLLDLVGGKAPRTFDDPSQPPMPEVSPDATTDGGPIEPVRPAGPVLETPAPDDSGPELDATPAAPLTATPRPALERPRPEGLDRRVVVALAIAAVLGVGVLLVGAVGFLTALVSALLGALLWSA
ncbi:MAG: protein kinase [Myxococcales bacterium]|nr:protein kinase [Myxococcales bacterium]